MSRMAGQQGLSSVELLVALAMVGILASLSLGNGHETLARRQLDAATRRLDLGLQRARSEARRMDQPCALSLSAEGWRPPSTGGLQPCYRTLESLKEPVAAGEVKLSHNFPERIRFSRNGLVIDGGTAVLTRNGTNLQRCLVMSLPLGITRIGRYREGRCESDPTL